MFMINKPLVLQTAQDGYIIIGESNGLVKVPARVSLLTNVEQSLFLLT